MKILLTLGGTAEAIDGVRFITNFSSGATGSFLADEFAKQGHFVKALCSKTAKVIPSLAEKEFYTDFNSLNSLIKRHLEETEFNLIVHLAAVSDFSPVCVICGGKKIKAGAAKKLSSSAKSMTIKLKRNFKIVERIKKYSPRKIAVAAFKLTNGAEKAQAQEAAAKVKGADFVIHNDLSEINSEKRLFTFYQNGEKQKICPLQDLPEQILKSAEEVIIF